MMQVCVSICKVFALLKCQWNVCMEEMYQVTACSTHKPKRAGRQSQHSQCTCTFRCRFSYLCQSRWELAGEAKARAKTRTRTKARAATGPLVETSALELRSARSSRDDMVDALLAALTSVRNKQRSSRSSWEADDDDYGCDYEDDYEDENQDQDQWAGDEEWAGHSWSEGWTDQQWTDQAWQGTGQTWWQSRNSGRWWEASEEHEQDWGEWRAEDQNSGAASASNTPPEPKTPMTPPPEPKTPMTPAPAGVKAPLPKAQVRPPTCTSLGTCSSLGTRASWSSKPRAEPSRWRHCFSLGRGNSRQGPEPSESRHFFGRGPGLISFSGLGPQRERTRKRTRSFSSCTTHHRLCQQVPAQQRHRPWGPSLVLQRSSQL